MAFTKNMLLAAIEAGEIDPEELEPPKKVKTEAQILRKRRSNAKSNEKQHKKRKVLRQKTGQCK